MNEDRTKMHTNGHPDGSEDVINLLEYLLVLVEHKKMILLVTVAGFVLACGATLLMPNIYTATARILPSSEGKGGLSTMLGGMGDLAALAGISAGGGSGDLYVAMMRSRTVSDAIIERFELMQVYEQKYRTSAYEALSKHVNISLGKKDGIIAVSVNDENPGRAAAMANAYVEELKKLNIELNLSNAGRERLFLERRLGVVKKDLVEAEESLRQFQEQNKAIRIDAQATAIIEAIAQLKAELAGKEVQLGVLLSYQTEQNPEVKALREGIVQIKNQIRRLEQSPSGKEVSGEVFITTAEVPALGVQYARLLRDFKVQETLFELLTKQYELAKINEAKNTSTIQVLDSAISPDKKSKPRRVLIVLVVTFAFAFAGIVFALVRNFVSQLGQESRDQWQKIKNR